MPNSWTWYVVIGTISVLVTGFTFGSPFKRMLLSGHLAQYLGTGIKLRTCVNIVRYRVLQDDDWMEKRFPGLTEKQLQHAVFTYIELCTQLVDNPETIYDGSMIIYNRKIRLYEDVEYNSEYDHLQDFFYLR